MRIRRHGSSNAWPVSTHLDPGLVALLRDRSDEITTRWHRDLDDRIALRPNNVFPGDALLDGMPRLVDWITRSLEHGGEPGEVNEEALRDVAGHWRRAGYSIEESLLHFRMLASLLFETLEEVVVSGEASVSAAEGIRAASRLCHAIDLAQVVLVATYRDAEEERITAFGETLAHEVRDQLGASMTTIQLIRTLREDPGPGLDPEREDELLEGAEDALAKANELVSAVRTVSQTSVGGGVDWAMRPLGPVIREIVAEAQAKAGPEVELRVDDELPETLVPEDPVSLILHNLIENGIKYRDPQKDERWVRVQARAEGDGHLVVQVGDNGLGISEREQERVFNRFHRGSEARGDGFGLGLSIARRATRSIGGRMMLESDPGHGSTFGFTVPEESQGDPAGS